MKVDAVGKLVFPFSPFLRQEQAPFTLNGTSLRERHLEIFIFVFFACQGRGHAPCTLALRASRTCVYRGLTGRVTGCVQRNVALMEAVL